MKPEEVRKIVYERFGAHYIFTLSDEALKDIADQLEILFKERTLEIIGEYDEAPDFTLGRDQTIEEADRLKARNNLRREQRERLK